MKPVNRFFSVSIMKGVCLDVAVVAVTPSCAYGIAADVKKASTGWANGTRVIEEFSRGGGRVWALWRELADGNPLRGPR